MSRRWYICLEKKNSAGDTSFEVLESVGAALTPINSQDGMKKVSAYCAVHDVRKLRILDDIHFDTTVETNLV